MLFLHISDIHFRSPDCLDARTDPDTAYRTRLLRDVRERIERLGRIDAILVGGDVAFKGSADEFAVAKKWLEELAEACKCDFGRVFVVPGNHDIDRNKITGSLTLQSVHARVLGSDENQIERVFRAHTRDPETTKSLLSPLDAYNDFAAIFSCQAYAPNHLNWQQDMEIRDGIKLRLHGLASPIFCAVGAPDDREDKPGDLYLSPLQTVLDPVEDVVNLVMCHHPPDWFRDGSEVEDAFRGRAMVHLLGHKHKQRQFKDDKYARFAAPAVTPPRTERGWRPGYNIIDLTVEGYGEDRELVVKAHLLQWQEDPEMFRAIQMSDKSEVFKHRIAFPGRDKPAHTTNPTQAADTRSNENEAHSDPIEVEAAMGDLRTRNLVLRFWKLPSSVRWDIALQLSLIKDADYVVPEPERYGRALLLAGERNQLNELADAIELHEAA